MKVAAAVLGHRGARHLPNGRRRRTHQDRDTQALRKVDPDGIVVGVAARVIEVRGAWRPQPVVHDEVPLSRAHAVDRKDLAAGVARRGLCLGTVEHRNKAQGGGDPGSAT